MPRGRIQPVAGVRGRAAARPPASAGAGPTDGAEVGSVDAPTTGPTGPELLVVGRIGRPQGIRGEVTVELHTDDPAARFATSAVLRTEPVDVGPLVVEASRDHSGRLVVAFAGVVDRAGAQALRGTLLQVDAAALPAPEAEDEFHDHVLRGMTAVLASGPRLGSVSDVLHLPHGDVLAIKRDDGREVLVPFVLAMVPEVDPAARRLVIDPPDGLLELADQPSGRPDG